MDPLQRMGAVRIRVQTTKKYHNNTKVIHTTTAHQLMYCEAKAVRVCVCKNKSTIKTFLFDGTHSLQSIHWWCNAKFL